MTTSSPKLWGSTPDRSLSASIPARGVLGYQVCDDFLKVMARASAKYGIELPDRQLAAAPLGSEEGKRYLAAMSAAANYALPIGR